MNDSDTKETEIKPEPTRRPFILGVSRLDDETVGLAEVADDLGDTGATED